MDINSIKFPSPSYSHEGIEERGSFSGGPVHPGKSTPKVEPIHTAGNGMPAHDQIQSFTESAPTDFPNGDWGDDGTTGAPSIPPVELHGQGDQRNYAEQTRLDTPGDQRITEGGSISNPTEDMPGAE